MTPAAEALERFAADLDALVPAGDAHRRRRLRRARQPGAAAARRRGPAGTWSRPRRSTMAFAPESADEAAMVAGVCKQLGVPHRTLLADWPEPPTANIQAAARAMRYRLLNEWAIDRGPGGRRHRSSCRRPGRNTVDAAAAGRGRRRARRDPGKARPVGTGNADPAAARLAQGGAGRSWSPRPASSRSTIPATAIRSMIAAASATCLHQADWADPARLAASASALRDADEALDWALAPLIGSRIRQDGGALIIEPFDLPRELKRRLLLAAFAELGAPPPRGPELDAGDRRAGGWRNGHPVRAETRRRIALAAVAERRRRRN